MDFLMKKFLQNDCGEGFSYTHDKLSNKLLSNMFYNLSGKKKFTRAVANGNSLVKNFFGMWMPLKFYIK